MADRDIAESGPVSPAHLASCTGPSKRALATEAHQSPRLPNSSWRFFVSSRPAVFFRSNEDTKAIKSGRCPCGLRWLLQPRADAAHPCAACHPKRFRPTNGLGWPVRGTRRPSGRGRGQPAWNPVHRHGRPTGMRHRLERAPRSRNPIELLSAPAQGGAARQATTWLSRRSLTTPTARPGSLTRLDRPGLGFRRRITDGAFFVMRRRCCGPRHRFERCHGPTSSISATLRGNHRGAKPRPRATACASSATGGEVPSQPGPIDQGLAAGRTLERFFGFTSATARPLQGHQSLEQLALSAAPG